ncbi:unnamed protein product, partial [Mesorhabditis spiculigera]
MSSRTRRSAGADGTSSLNPTTIQLLDRNRLVKELESRGLATVGSKNILADRLYEFVVNGVRLEPPDTEDQKPDKEALDNLSTTPSGSQTAPSRKRKKAEVVPDDRSEEGTPKAKPKKAKNTPAAKSPVKLKKPKEEPASEPGDVEAVNPFLLFLRDREAAVENQQAAKAKETVEVPVVATPEVQEEIPESAEEPAEEAAEATTSGRPKRRRIARVIATPPPEEPRRRSKPAAVIVEPTSSTSVADEIEEPVQQSSASEDVKPDLASMIPQLHTNDPDIFDDGLSSEDETEKALLKKELKKEKKKDQDYVPGVASAEKELTAEEKEKERKRRLREEQEKELAKERRRKEKAREREKERQRELEKQRPKQKKARELAQQAQAREAAMAAKASTSAPAVTPKEHKKSEQPQRTMKPKINPLDSIMDSQEQFSRVWDKDKLLEIEDEKRIREIEARRMREEQERRERHERHRLAAGNERTMPLKMPVITPEQHKLPSPALPPPQLVMPRLSTQRSSVGQGISPSSSLSTPDTATILIPPPPPPPINMIIPPPPPPPRLIPPPPPAAPAWQPSANPRSPAGPQSPDALDQPYTPIESPDAVSGHNSGPSSPDGEGVAAAPQDELLMVLKELRAKKDIEECIDTLVDNVCELCDAEEEEEQLLLRPITSEGNEQRASGPAKERVEIGLELLSDPVKASELLSKASNLLSNIMKSGTTAPKPEVIYAQEIPNEEDLSMVVEEERPLPEFHGEPVPSDDDDALFEAAAGIPPSQRTKKKKRGEEEIEEETLPPENAFQLDYYNADLHIKCEADKEGERWSVIHPENADGLGLCIGGVKTTFGVPIPYEYPFPEKAPESGAGVVSPPLTTSDVTKENAKPRRLVFQAKVREHLSTKHLPFEEIEPYEVRVGFSLGNSSTIIGENNRTWCFCTSGKVASNNVFTEWGRAVALGEVITAELNLETRSISFYIDGEKLGTAYTDVPFADGDVVYPSISIKNCKVAVNLGNFPDPEENWGHCDPEWTFASWLDLRTLIRARVPPESKADCTVLMMVGLPGVGKTTWVRHYLRDHPDELWNLISADTMLNQMKINGVPRSRVHVGRWDMVMGLAAKAVNRYVTLACRRRRNYIIDATNCGRDARKRKLTNFKDFRRKCVVIIPSDEEWQTRLARQARHDAKAIMPVECMLELKSTFTIPTPEHDPLEDVHFIEPSDDFLQQAVDLVQRYNEEARPWVQEKFKRRRGGPRGDYGGNYGNRPQRDRFIPDNPRPAWVNTPYRPPTQMNSPSIPPPLPRLTINTDFSTSTPQVSTASVAPTPDPFEASQALATGATGSTATSGEVTPVSLPPLSVSTDNLSPAQTPLGSKSADSVRYPAGIPRSQLAKLNRAKENAILGFPFPQPSNDIPPSPRATPSISSPAVQVTPTAVAPSTPVITRQLSSPIVQRIATPMSMPAKITVQTPAVPSPLVTPTTAGTPRFMDMSQPPPVFSYSNQPNSGNQFVQYQQPNFGQQQMVAPPALASPAVQMPMQQPGQMLGAPPAMMTMPNFAVPPPSWPGYQQPPPAQPPQPPYF